MVETYCGLICTGCEYKEKTNCGGCVATQGNPFHGECQLAKCCISKKHNHCGECSDFPCELLVSFSNDEEYGDKPKGKRIEQLKKWNNETK